MRNIYLSFVWLFVFLFAVPVHAEQKSEFLYMHVSDNGVEYFSRLVELPYSPDDVTYKSEGQAAKQRAVNNFVNAIKEMYGASVYAHAVSVVRKPSHMTREEFEGERLDKVRQYRTRVTSDVRVL